jgi:hypothetical protein
MSSGGEPREEGRGVVMNDAKEARDLTRGIDISEGGTNVDREQGSRSQMV